MRQKKIRNILMTLSIIGIIGTGLGAILLPKLSSIYSQRTDIKIRMDVLIFLWISMIPLCVMLFEFYKMSKSLKDNLGFEDKTIVEITRIKICLGIEFALYIFGIARYKNILTFIILMGIIIIYVFATIVKEILLDGKEFYEDSRLSI